MSDADSDPNISVHAIGVRYANPHIPQMNEPNSERVITPISKSLVKAVDDFRFANRIPTRSQAIRQLLALGLNTATSASPTGYVEAVE